MFLVPALGKKIVEAIEFIGILKKYFSKNKKYIFLFKKKGMSCLIKNDIFIFYTIFKLSWSDHLLYYPQMSVFSFHTFFVLLYQSLRHVV